MSVIAPPPLRTGDTIAIVPTARAITAEELGPGIALAESWGLRVRLGDGVDRKHFQQAGTDEQRAADLQKAIDDPEVKAIWCARGGYGTVRLLDHLDLTALQKDPKWVIGFSDVTVLHNALHHIGVHSLHAQMPFNIHGKTQACKESIRQALFGEYRPIEYPVINRAGLRTGECEGELVGGNLSILYALRGTPYDLRPQGKILFLEDLDELLYHMDRMVQNLRISGWFKGLAGLMIGGMSDMRNKNADDPFGMSAEEIIAQAVGEVDYPVCYGAPAGHIDDNRTLVLGNRARLAVSEDRVRLEFAPYPT